MAGEGYHWSTNLILTLHCKRTLLASSQKSKPVKPGKPEFNLVVAFRLSIELFLELPTKTPTRNL